MFLNEMFTYLFDLGRDYGKSRITRQKPYKGIMYLICIIQHSIWSV